MIRLTQIFPIIALVALCASCGKPAASNTTAEDEAAETASEGDEKKKEPEQTYQEGWQIICDAQELSGVDKKLTRLTYNAQVVQWLVANLKNKKARLWFIEFGQIKENRQAYFEAEAKRGGVENCALSVMLFPPAVSPPEGTTPTDTSHNSP